MSKIPSNYLFSSVDLRKLIFPLIIEQFLTIAVGMVDSIMIASVGEAAVSAVSLVDTINVLLINIFTALATGGAVVVGQYLGRRANKQACGTADQIVIFSFLVSLVIMALVYVLRGFILHTVFGDITEEVSNYALRYLLIVSASIPFIAIYNAGAAIFRAMGNSRISMTTSIIMNMVNIVGNAVLIYGFKMQVEGVAIPTLISRVVAAVVIMALLKNQALDVHISMPFKFRLDKNTVKKILRIGAPNALENSMFQLGKILVLTIVTGFGTSAIAANAVSNTAAMFQILSGMAMSTAVLTVVSQCVGAMDFKQVKFYVRKCMKFGYISLIIINGVMLLCMPLILRAYNLSAETTEMARNILWYHSICVCTIWPLSFVIPSALRAANDVMFPMVVATISMWVMRVGASVFITKFFDIGVLGIWIAMTLDWAVRSVFFGIRYKGLLKKRLKGSDKI